MNKKEKQTIQELIDKGYLVVVSNPMETNFAKKYSVYQGNARSNKLKLVVINDDGRVLALQG